MNRIVKIGLVVLLGVVIAGGSFYGGMVYGENQAQAEFPVLGDAEGMPSGGEQFGAPPGGQAGVDRGQIADAQGGSLFGEIQSIGNGEMTIVDQSGEQVQIYVTDTTLIQKQAEVTLADLQEGETVAISGSQATDGSITARMVQVSSAGGFGLPGNLPPGGQPGSGTSGANP
jgi:hypothetical protein